MNVTEPQRLRYLLALYAANACTRAEMDELFALVRDTAADTALHQAFLDEWNALQAVPPLVPVDWDGMFDKVLQTEVEAIPVMIPVARKKGITTRWLAAAAAMLAVIAGVWLWSDSRKPAGKGALAVVRDIPPGYNGAILTLADGSQVVLDSAENGKVATQTHAVITKQNGQLIYQNKAVTAETDPVPAINTLSTPRGRQYQLVLPDGTKVWLNAGSSIRYPTFFTGKTREVTVTGEVYLEVAQQTAHPFIVTAPQQTVEVLGTSFNINTYENEADNRTTLLVGAVSVKTIPEAGVHTQNRAILSPGQQAILNPATGTMEVKAVDAAQTIAWKNGQFHFDHAGIPDVMRQLERWYDIEVSYKGAIPQRQFGGKIERSLPLSAVLQFLEESHVHCQLEGNHLTVMP